MHLHLTSLNLFASARRLLAARPRPRLDLFRLLVGEFRRALSAARRHEELRTQRGVRNRLGIGSTDITRQVFDEHYSDRATRR